MRIGSISELSNLNIDFSDLIDTSKIQSGDLLVEVSKKRDGESISYDSKCFDLGKLCQQINQILTSLQDQINNLNTKTNDISENYVKKAGDEMTGTLSIDVSTSRTPALVLKTTNDDYILSSNSNNFYFGDNVVINDGQLKCTKDIAGVALEAKWS